MRAARTILMLTLFSAALVASPLQAEEATPQERPRMLLSHRVYYLQGMEPREAMTLVRTRPGVRKIVIVPGRAAMVLCDEAPRLDEAEAVLREHDAILRIAEPNAPMFLEEMGLDTSATGIFDVEPGRTLDVVTILRTMYDVRNLQKSEEGNRVTIQAAPPIVSAADALLRELGLLVPVASAGKS
jgi:hypothetical protein